MLESIQMSAYTHLQQHIHKKFQRNCECDITDSAVNVLLNRTYLKGHLQLND